MKKLINKDLLVIVFIAVLFVVVLFLIQLAA